MTSIDLDFVNRIKLLEKCSRIRIFPKTRFLKEKGLVLSLLCFNYDL